MTSLCFAGRRGRSRGHQHKRIIFDPARNTYYLALMVGCRRAGWAMVSSRGRDHKVARQLKQAAESTRRNHHVLGDPEQSLSRHLKRSVPTVYVSTVPTELLRAGQPRFTPIPGTNLFYVELWNDIFMDSPAPHVLCLVSGRWFASSRTAHGHM
jgi:hypothetical protein